MTADTVVFISGGPGAMMQAVCKTIVSLGGPNDNVSTEECVSPKVASAESSNVGMNGDATSGTLIDGEVATITFATSGEMVDIDSSVTILEAAELAGVSLP